MPLSRSGDHKRGFAPLGCFLAVIACDQALKSWVEGHLRIFGRMPILGQSWLVVSRVLNRGLLGDRYSTIPDGFIEPYTRYFPTAVWLVLLAWAATRIRSSSRGERWGFSLLLAGGISNLISHWVSGAVVDPLQIYIGSLEYLPFNLADVAISAGMVLVWVALIRPSRARPASDPHRQHERVMV